MSVTNRLLPGNSTLAMAQAAETPKTRFAGTEIAATKRVNLMAATAAKSLNEAKKTPSPFFKASQNTANKGARTKIPRNKTATVIRRLRTHFGSCTADRLL